MVGTYTSEELRLRMRELADRREAALLRGDHDAAEQYERACSLANTSWIRALKRELGQH